MLLLIVRNMGTQTSHKSRSRHKMNQVTYSRPTVYNLVARATWRSGFVPLA